MTLRGYWKMWVIVGSFDSIIVILEKIKKTHERFVDIRKIILCRSMRDRLQN